MKAKHTILVVDDEPDVVKSVQDLLRLDYRVLGATRAADGLDIMQREEVHVVMTDQRMPEMTGVELLHKLRCKYPEAIRLLFTGYADIRAVIDAINAGNVYRYITKPWDPDELASVIREACDRYDLIVQRDHLLDELKVTNKELETANHQLKESDDLKTAFIQVASHELRTPLQILLGFSRLAETTTDLSPQMKEWLGRITNAGKRLQHLVDQLITMLSLGRFDLTVERKETDLQKLLNTSAEDIRPFIELRHQKLSVDAPGDLGMVWLDEEKIRESVNHLLLNAVKFTPDGGSIKVLGRRDGDNVEIRVIDTGVGIDTACQSKLFQPFFTGFDVRHHSSGQYEYNRRGIGLGLTVVKGFVEKHGGTIQVESTAGQGTTFIIHLPARENQNA